MKTKKDWNFGELDWRRLGLSLGISVLGMLALTALCAWLMDRETVSRDWENYLAALILLLSGFAGALTARSREDRWKGPLVVAGGFWLVLLTINALLFGGDLSGAGATALAILGGSGAGMLLGGGGKRRSGSRRKYRRR